MPALSFSELRFAGMVAAGTKCQTIRPFKTGRAKQLKDNPKLHLWYRQRRPEGFKIGTAIMNSLEIIRIKPATIQLVKTGFEIPDYRLNPFAQTDGFSGWEEFYRWFENRYKEDLDEMPFSLIRWDYDSFVPDEATKSQALLQEVYA